MVMMTRCFMFAFGLFILISFQHSVTSAEKLDTRSMVAKLSYNFAKYASWPEAMTKKKTIDLCYFSDRLKSSFGTLKGKKIDNKPIIVKQLSGIEQSHSCHLIFIDKTEGDLTQQLFMYLADKPVLTVSDIVDFVDEGGMIEVVRKENKFHFKVNQQQLDKAQLKMSSQVLKLAVDVK
ncbi:YfiR family protein [Methylophaga sp.]|uniref:YfiR family protein n=1 Tax=Methylophaga sp. TaxID=2024840 RepID=UPI003F6A1345